MERFKKLQYEHFDYISISNQGRLRNDITMEFYSLRFLKSKMLSFCDVSKVVDGDKKRMTIMIAHEVAFAFIDIPHDYDKVTYRATHKKGFSKLNNNYTALEWKKQSDIIKNNMSNPKTREKISKKLTEIRNTDYKDSVKKKHIRKSRTILSKDKFLSEKKELEDRLNFINKSLKIYYPE